jgi:hypothetical protein
LFKQILLFFQGNIWAASGAGSPEPGPRPALQALGTYSQGKRHSAIFSISNIVCRSCGSGSGIFTAGFGKRIPTIPVPSFSNQNILEFIKKTFVTQLDEMLKKIGFCHCFALFPGTNHIRRATVRMFDAILLLKGYGTPGFSILPGTPWKSLGTE